MKVESVQIMKTLTTGKWDASKKAISEPTVNPIDGSENVVKLEDDTSDENFENYTRLIASINSSAVNALINSNPQQGELVSYETVVVVGINRGDGEGNEKPKLQLH